ncbi:winged helix-turn-helix domain-containing protein [Cellulomonas composti]|uniref:Winged helix-turn-helix domain-containing protein n=1 Tax=Cellulomonas composti TaxID=266130 RepID=A0A511JBQ2_9CELL|nr:crosslink repair DNA glycosylase YcaQ family protein [Cellulomonas composti]GEL95133.1 hypothetical protein CCO02nite_17910 [Cellulomonas composti]
MANRHQVQEEHPLSRARRIALRAQGLDRGRPSVEQVTMRHVQQVVDRLGLLQIDSVNVLARAHLVPVYSRMGPYDPALIDRASARSPRRLVEAWAHVASFVPPHTLRLLAWRQRAYQEDSWGMIRDVPLQQAALVEDVRALLRERGPLTAAQVHELLEGAAIARVHWGWNWSDAKRVLEFLFFTGEVTSAGRNPAFERRYDLTERVLPPHVLAEPEPSKQDAVRELVRIAARANGIGSAQCLADYFRVRTQVALAAIDDLVDAGELVPSRVAGWDREVYRHRDAVAPRRSDACALLSPFDPLVFERRRLEELFGLRYRIEIYVPEAQRVWGYYVLPFLLGERIAALVDLKADRATGTLLVRAAHHPPTSASGAARARDGSDESAVVAALVPELRLAARWLGLDEVRIDPSGLGGDLVAPLHRELTAA